jgi:catechol 2,3-dioxygenase-like lactoylglutathione lyase family enzyme
LITAMPRIAIAVQDFGAAITTFRDTFGMPVVDFSDATVPGLGAHVAMCRPEGGSNIELMSPADPAAPLGQSLLKFLDKRGDGLFALMLEAPDPDVEATALAERGLDVLPLMTGASGRDVHPRSTHGVLVRVYPDNSVRHEGETDSADPWLSGIAKVIVATTDASLAADVYGRGFGLDVDPIVEDGERGVLCARCRPPKGGVIELVSAHDTGKTFASDIERFEKERGQGMYALVLQTAEPAAAASKLGTATFFGTRFLIERPE